MRLTPEHWITAGFDALVSKGPAALAAEPLARQIGTTKGSFYWHFKDVPAFHSALVDSWRANALSNLSAAVGNADPPDQRLRQFGRDLLSDQVETALRNWAPSNAKMTAILHQVDAERLTYLTLLLRELGLGNTDFARALQATLIGLPQISDDVSVQHATLDTLIDTVLAL